MKKKTPMKPKHSDAKQDMKMLKKMVKPSALKPMRKTGRGR